MMNGDGKSDRPIVPKKPPNKGVGTPAPASKPEDPVDLGADESLGEPLDSTGASRASLPGATAVRHDPRQEPSALAALAGICAGGGPNPRAKGRPYRDPNLRVEVDGERQRQGIPRRRRHSVSVDTTTKQKINTVPEPLYSLQPTASLGGR